MDEPEMCLKRKTSITWILPQYQHISNQRIMPVFCSNCPARPIPGTHIRHELNQAINI